MEVLRKSIHLSSTKEYIDLIPLGDVHAGAAACDERSFIETIDRIASNSHTYTILMGDLADCILPDDKRFDATEVAAWLWNGRNRGRIVDAQYDWILEQLRKIPSARILGALRGNHENTIRAKHYRDLTLDLSRNLDIPYLDEQAFIQLKFTRDNSRSSRIYDVYAIHGSSSGRKAGSKVNLIQDLTSIVDADCILMGHVHDKIASRDTKLYLDAKGNLKTKERLYIITGTYLKTYEPSTASYGARANFRAVSIGSPTIRIKPFSGHDSGTIKTEVML